MSAGVWRLARDGSYLGLAAGHAFNVVIVTGEHSVGGDTANAPDKATHHEGAGAAAS